ncbi:glycosyltransferase family 39 protein [Polyangium sp. 6x1]|uniref:ArnT family glycosyltransferase n=1 Tax=Polyangium sp. 6x1 TaxID=3042689 RepID=UPI00248215AC|nr:glycosyltransferase family 39 protein [Polyangium sp. 6x1]MDI1446349.1 glycosyltransferase family 39 protein [Polyangium sp. 6x1]
MTLAADEPSSAPERATPPPAPVIPGHLEILAERALIATCLAALAFLFFQILTFGHGRDQGIYTVVARTVLEGGMPYRDAWDFKPPGIFLVYALARLLFGSAQWGIRALEVTGLVLMTFGMTRLTRRFWGTGTLGLLAATITVLVHAQLDFWHTSQPESFGGMITIAALLCAPRKGPSGLPSAAATKARDWLVAGFLFGFAGLLKPPLVGGAAIIALLPAWWDTDPARPTLERLRAAARGVLRPSLLLAVGGAIPIAICAAWFAARGALGDLHRVLFVFTPHYTALGWQGAAPTAMFYWAFTEWLQQYGSVPTVGLLLALGLGVCARERPLVWLSLGVVFVHLVGVTMQGKFFPYHYGATWPLTGLVAALGYHALFQRARARGALGLAGFFLVLLIVPFGRTATKDVPGSFLVRTQKRLGLATEGFQNQRGLDELASVADVNTVTNRAVADLLRSVVPANRPVFVWGFEPSIYDMADRAAATRYIYNVPQRVAWAREEHQKVLLADLEKAPPAAIVVEHYDVFPHVTGDAFDSADSLRDFPAMQRLLDEKYVLHTSIGQMDVYLEATEEKP